VRVIEEVEKLRPELQVDLLGERRVLDDGDVEILVPRPVDDVAPRIPEGAEGLEGEGRGVKPALGRAAREPRVAHQVRPVVVTEAEVRAPGVAQVEGGGGGA